MQETGECAVLNYSVECGVIGAMRCKFLVIGFASLLLWPSSGSARETSVVAEIDRLLQRVETISQHHVESPSRQQMILTLARAIFQATGRVASLDLASEVSRRTKTEDFRHILEDALADANPESREKVARFAVDALLRSLPGNCEEVPAKEYRVNEQLAANRYVGIGIVLGKTDGIPTAMKAFPGGPFYRVGGRDQDQIWSVDGEDVREKELGEVVDSLRGPRGTQLWLEFGTSGGKKMVRKQITRDVVPLRSLAEPEYLKESILYLKINQFRASLAHELRSLEPELRQRKVLAVILDFRGIRPGRVHDVILLADALLPGGTIGTLEGEVLEASEDAILARMPLAVLVDTNTRGSLEWLAASLQANQRAVIVGGLTPGEPWGYEGFELPHEERFLVIPSKRMGITPDRSLVSHRALETLPSYVQVQFRERWGVVPNVWIGGEMLDQSIQGGWVAERVAVEHAKEALLEILEVATR